MREPTTNTARPAGGPARSPRLLRRWVHCETAENRASPHARATAKSRPRSGTAVPAEGRLSSTQLLVRQRHIQIDVEWREIHCAVDQLRVIKGRDASPVRLRSIWWQEPLPMHVQ